MTDLLDELYQHLGDDLDGIQRTPDALRFLADGRYGEVTVVVEHDASAEMLRVSAAVPAPAGSGRSFLIWALALNSRYWDVKTGLDRRGRLLVHSDLDAPADAELSQTAVAVVERADAVADLVDQDLVDWLLEHGLGTPEQRERWKCYGDETEVD